MQKLIRSCLACLVMASPLCADEPFTSGAELSNAALVYWQAFSFLPRLDADQRTLLDEIEAGRKPVSAAKPLIESSSIALNFISIVPAKTECRWELIESGPGTLLPHLAKARLSARLMIQKARLAAAAGNNPAAFQCVASTILLARNVDEGVLVQLLVGDTLEALAIDQATALIPSAHRSTLEKFSRDLAEFPPRTTIAQAMTYERDLFGGWIKELMDGNRESARTTLKNLGNDLQADDLDAIVAGTQSDRRKRVKQFIEEYNRIISAAKQPAGKTLLEIEQMEQSLQESSNPLIRTLMPTFSRAMMRHAKIDQRLADLEEELKEAIGGSQQDRQR